MTIDISYLPALAAAFMLVFARTGTMVMLLPGLGEQNISARMRLTIALILAAVLLPLHRSAYHIDPGALEAITAPTLVLASDHDLIRDEHTLEIYHHLPNAELCIFPNATHMIPFDDPELFDATVERFFQTPFVKKDRVKDLIKSAAAMQAARK